MALQVVQPMSSEHKGRLLHNPIAVHVGSAGPWLDGGKHVVTGPNGQTTARTKASEARLPLPYAGCRKSHLVSKWSCR